MLYLFTFVCICRHMVYVNMYLNLNHAMGQPEVTSEMQVFALVRSLRNETIERRDDTRRKLTQTACEDSGLTLLESGESVARSEIVNFSQHRLRRLQNYTSSTNISCTQFTLNSSGTKLINRFDRHMIL
jgi:hypothetical protein